MLRSSLCLAVVFLFSYSVADDPVPLLAWSNSDLLSHAQSKSSLGDIFSDVKVSDFKVAVILKSTSLSFDDIAKYGGVYGEKNAPLSNLRSFLSTSPSSLSAGVTGPAGSDLTSLLSFAMDVNPIYIPGVYYFPKLRGKGSHLIVVEMSEGEDEETFRNHDSTIAETVSILRKTNLPYVIFYTADTTVNPAHADLSQDLVRRSILLTDAVGAQKESDPNLCYSIRESGTENGKSNDSLCMLVCVSSTMTYMEGKDLFSANSTQDFNFTGGACVGEMDKFPGLKKVNYSYVSLDVSLRGVNGTGERTKTLVFVFMKGDKERDSDSGFVYSDKNETISADPGFWTLLVFAGDSDDSIDSVEFYEQFHRERIFSRPSIPLNVKDEKGDPDSTTLSYACGNSSLNNFTRTVGNITYSFQLYGIQVQPFTNLQPVNGKFFFGTASNCQGYFTTASWMGVVSVLILLLILYISYVFVFSIQTIDRFDDPRGETIKVENLH